MNFFKSKPLTSSNKAIFWFSMFAAFVAPFSESLGSSLRFFEIFAVSVFTTTFALAAAIVLVRFANRSQSRWPLIVLISLATGALKGWLTWEALDYLSLSQLAFESRLLYSAVAWGLILPITIGLSSELSSILTANKILRRELAQARQSFDSLEKELEWMIEARVNGLSEDLAAKFIKLSTELNQSGQGQLAFAKIASELRSVARDEVRATSVRVWTRAGKPSFVGLARQLAMQLANPTLTAILFAVGHAVNAWRLEGFSYRFAIGFALGAVLFTLLKMPALHGLWQHSIPLIIGCLAFFGYLIAEVEVWNAAQYSAATWLWAEVSILITSTWALAIALSKKERSNLTEENRISDEDVKWVSSRLAAADLELAKYLHAVLQTRLMAHAMKIEQDGRLSEKDLPDLKNLLTKPLSGFGEQQKSFNDGLNELVKNWGELVHFRIFNQANPAVDAQVTLQVIREAIANSVRHGLADAVSLEINDLDDYRFISVTDNGIGPRSGPPGMGTQVFDSLCEEHSLTQTIEGGSAFFATIKI